MMILTNKCTRCGKDRVIAKKWKEKINGCATISVAYKCPDPECQKKVEKILRDKQEHAAALHASSVMKREENKNNHHKVSIRL